MTPGPGASADGTAGSPAARPAGPRRPVRSSDYDRQAAVFDRRTGLDGTICRSVARAVVDTAGAEPGDLVVEAGVGTGLIGRWLAGERVRYLGFDFSPSMLAVFRGKLAAARAASPAAASARLLCADGAADWPLADGVARALFASRALHLLAPRHVAQEFVRVASPRGAALLVGRVQRQSSAVRARMASELRARLAARGLEPIAGERRTGELLAECRALGCEPLPPREIGRWQVSAAPRQSLDAWTGKDGLAGTRPPAAIEAEVLTELAAWARRELGDLDRHHTSREAYVLEGVRLPPRR